MKCPKPTFRWSTVHTLDACARYSYVSSMMEESKDGVWLLMSCGWNQGSGSIKSGSRSQAIACVEKRLKRKPRNTWARYFTYTACPLIYQDEMVLGMSLGAGQSLCDLAVFKASSFKWRRCISSLRVVSYTTRTGTLKYSIQLHGWRWERLFAPSSRPLSVIDLSRQ
jgi:hypothetical protein